MRRFPALLVVLAAGVGGSLAFAPGAASAQEEKKPAPPAAPPAAPPSTPPSTPPSAPPSADGEKPAAPKDGAAAKPAAKPEEKAPEEGPVTGTLYSVRLKSGRAVRGVVHATTLWEKKDRQEGWVAAKREDEGAGLRLWYPSLLDGFLFISEKQVAQIEDLGALSAEEGKRISKERSEAASRADAERVRLKTEAEERAAKEAAAATARAEVAAARKEAAAAGAGKVAAGTAGAMVPLDRARRFAELLEKFPPSVWHPDTPKEIERRRLILDLFPTDEEKDFLSVYAEWREAYEFWKQGGGDDVDAAPAPERKAAASAKPAAK